MPLAHSHFLALIHRFFGYKISQSLQTPSSTSLANFIAPHTQIDTFFYEWFSGYLWEVALQLPEVANKVNPID